MDTTASGASGASIGRLVHFILPGGAHRPALVVSDPDTAGRVNLQVFCNGPDDLPYNARFENERKLWAVTTPDQRERMRVRTAWHPIMWEESVVFDGRGEYERSWHWPERVPTGDGGGMPASAYGGVPVPTTPPAPKANPSHDVASPVYGEMPTTGPAAGVVPVTGD